MPVLWRLDRWKAKPGKERERYELRALRNRALGSDRHATARALEEQIREVSVSVYEVIGAPIIGRDPEATPWFINAVAHVMGLTGAQLEACEVDAQEGLEVHARGALLVYGMPMKQVAANHAGLPVLALARDKGGFDQSIPWPTVDFLVSARVRRALPPDLRERVARPHVAGELDDLCDALFHADVPQFIRDTPFLLNAGVWLRYWARQGFGFDTMEADPRELLGEPMTNENS